MATPSEQLDRIKEKEKISKAKTKAFWMRVTEGASMVGTAALVEVIAVKALDGRQTLGTSGFMSRITLDGVATGLGLLGILFARGVTQDIASGMFNAGIVPIAHRWTAQAFGAAPVY